LSFWISLAVTKGRVAKPRDSYVEDNGRTSVFPKFQNEQEVDVKNTPAQFRCPRIMIQSWAALIWSSFHHDFLHFILLRRSLWNRTFQSNYKYTSFKESKCKFCKSSLLRCFSSIQLAFLVKILLVNVRLVVFIGVSCPIERKILLS